MVDERTGKQSLQVGADEQMRVELPPQPTVVLDRKENPKPQVWFSWPETQAYATAAISADRARRAPAEGVPVAWVCLRPDFADEHRRVFTDEAEAEKYHRCCYELTPVYTTPQHAGEVAPGFVMVPVEPTEAMLAAGKIPTREISLGNGTTAEGLGLGADPRSIYRAMLSAATGTKGTGK